MPSNRPTMRNVLNVTADTSGEKLAGPNPRRRALIVSAPVPTVASPTPNIQIAGAADTSGPGAKLSYTVPAGAGSMLLSASYFNLGGVAPTVALQFIRSGTIITLERGTINVDLSQPLPLSAGDIVQWNVTAGGAGSTGDFTLGIVDNLIGQRVTLFFGTAPVLDQCVNLFPGNNPLVLLGEHIGEAITEEIWVISSSGSLAVAAVEFFG